MKNKLIFTPKEINKMYEFAKTHDDNIVLHFGDTSIGTEYALQTQTSLWDNDKKLEYITDWENW